MEHPRNTIVATDTVRNDSVDEPVLLEGDVLAPEPDTLEEDEGETTEGFVIPWTDSDEPEAYMIVEEMPEFPNGEEAMMQYIAEQVKYPAEAKKAGAQGRVFIGFIVETDGSLSDIKVLRGIGFGCDEEAMRVVESMPKWQPGVLNGKAVRVFYQIPINFKLD